MYSTANAEETPIEVLAAGDTLQLLGKHMRLQQQIWQEVLVSRRSHHTISGWILLDGAEDSGSLVPLKKTSTVLQISTPDGQHVLAAAESNGQLFLETPVAAGDNGFFRVEAAAPCEMVAAACENGSVKFWTQDSAYSPWVQNIEASKPIQHGSPSTALTIMTTDAADDTASSMLAITCNAVDTAATVEQSVAIWRLDESQEFSQRFDQGRRIRAWTPFVTHNICRLQPLLVDDYVSGMVKYVDNGSGDGFEITYADPANASLTATDLLRTKAQFEGLFFQLISRLRLHPAVSNVSRRSTNRLLEPGNAFLRNENGDDYLYWITHASAETGYSATFQAEELLTLEDCVVGNVVRDASIPADQLGGIYVVEAVVHAVGAGYAADGNGAATGGTITVREIRPDNSLADDAEAGRDPGDFVKPGFWEGYRPPEEFPVLTFMVLPFASYDQTPAILARISQMLAAMHQHAPWMVRGESADAEAAATKAPKKHVSLHTIAPNLDQQRELEWQELLESARVGSPVQACVVELPNAAGPYRGSHIDFSRLLGQDDAADDDPVELSVLHACVAHSRSHPEDQHDLFSMEVPEVIVQYVIRATHDS
jgi:hypothetical protein